MAAQATPEAAAALKRLYQQQQQQQQGPSAATPRGDETVSRYQARAVYEQLQTQAQVQSQPYGQAASTSASASLTQTQPLHGGAALAQAKQQLQQQLQQRHAHMWYQQQQQQQQLMGRSGAQAELFGRRASGPSVSALPSNQLSALSAEQLLLLQQSAQGVGVTGDGGRSVEDFSRLQQYAQQQQMVHPGSAMVNPSLMAATSLPFHLGAGASTTVPGMMGNPLAFMYAVPPQYHQRQLGAQPGQFDPTQGTGRI